MPGHILKSSTGWTDDPMLIDINAIRVVVQCTICLQEPGLHPVGLKDIGTTHEIDNVIASIPTKCRI
eukprot:6836371-Prorocentrum_lima.AAC.1